ncbi:Prodigiosin synthesizing transferase PigC [Sinobacterium norvegicum]|uniref:Prodigiosin synthesizing transferase PigC n=1 Tax=Sinobacterium norvegicum TaxID=1641715 RepID=A0ABM9AH38_9GAMM|nr:PEP/pyruvate-binding domain-containing protein [Sinobacterium norvegicum]CAH0992535.1 Prodigiosin synthesizing transferase PigC [Sinobacterium norvegicum]
MTTITAASEILWIKDITNQPVGGKAHGLQQLMQWGLNVPNGFVIINAGADQSPPDLAAMYRQLTAGSSDAKVAVRSSALGEDGDAASFAGQYDTVLNVQGFEALATAIASCVQSLHSQHASAYIADNAVDDGTQSPGDNVSPTPSMNVVVQLMVDASRAGVLFTADPVSGRHDRLIVDAVEGLGEALVSGDQTPDHYEFDGANQLAYRELIGQQPVLTDDQCGLLMAQAREAVQRAGQPLDMEWAFDQRGELKWLQARPITTLGSDLNELDTPVKPGDVLTRCNVGEMMPNASCPLTFSTTGKAIEYGMQHMHVSYAGRAAINEDWTQLAMSHGFLFLNLSGSAVAASTVLGVDVKSLGASVCGRIVEGLEEPKKRPLWVRIGGMIRLLRYLQSADKVIADFRCDVEQFSLPTDGSSADIAEALDRAQSFLYQAYCVHLQSSTTSGFASNVMQGIISGGQQSSPEEEAEAAKLMAGASGVESAVLVEQLDAVVDQIATLIKGQPNLQTAFTDALPEQALAWLNTAAAEPARAGFGKFLDRHGHRSYRELCVREISWADDPRGLIASMQASVRAKIMTDNKAARPQAVDPKTLSRGLRWILPKAHNAVRRRESTKSLLVEITNRFKRSYRALGEQLADEGRLEDADQVFFFTHDELLAFVRDGKADADWRDKTCQRRRALAFQNRLEFTEISIGQPQPIDLRSLLTEQPDSGVIVGRPVSRGLVEGTARVAFSVAEAARLKPGEILVAPITDVGWTPYFNMIAGLITDVGSAVSHGAVIAREYGLPAIVNTRTGTKQITSGDTIRLDAHTGQITILASASASDTKTGPGGEQAAEDEKNHRTASY